MTEEYRGARLEHLDPRADGAHGTAPKFTEIISRHVQQAANFNKLLEKEQLWKERGKELARKHQDTAGVLRRDTFSEAANCRSGLGRAKRLLDSVEVKGVDRKDVERIKEKVAREFGSVDVFAAAREQTARLKEQRKLRLQEEQQDSWMPDKYYTDELKEKTPWFNPVQYLTEMQNSNAQREESLTPQASDTDSSTATRKKKKKKKTKKDKKKRKKRE